MPEMVWGISGITMIFLRHPVHGSKIASFEVEAEADERNGWVRYNIDTPSMSEVAAPVNELEVKRRGRPPRVISQGA
jgi:hypothetical protein